jgi:Isochorismatase family
VLAPLRASAPVFTKTVFGLADCPEIMAAVRSTGRRTALLAGFETDVCVTHSAVGLEEVGYRVVIVEDAVYSPFGAHLPGIARLRDLGFEVLRCKSVYVQAGPLRPAESSRIFLARRTAEERS